MPEDQEEKNQEKTKKKRTTRAKKEKEKPKEEKKTDEIIKSPGKKEEKEKKSNKEEKKKDTGKPGNEPKKLYRSRKYRVLAGVCGGIGEYFNVDPNIFRFLWVLACFAGGVGVIGYIIALIMIPEVPANVENEERVPTKSSREIGMLIGAVLIFLGVFFLLDRWVFFYFPYRFWRFRYFDFELLFPILIIIAGILYILHVHKKSTEEEKGAGVKREGEQRFKSMKRSVRDKKIAGVCGGIAEHFEIDPTIIRLLYILMTLYTGIWIGVIIYVVLAIIMPQEEPQTGGANK